MAWDDEEFSLSQFSNGGTMDDIRFDDRLTPPYRSTVDIEGPQESVAEYANPQAASNYVGGFDANWAETPQRQPWNHQEPFAPHQIYTQYPTGGYGEHHEHDSGDTVGGTRGDLDQTQSMGAFSFQQGMSMETNNGSSQQGYANNHQGSVYAPGNTLSGTDQYSHQPIMGPGLAGVSSQMAYADAQGMPFGNSPYPQSLFPQLQYQQSVSTWQNVASGAMAVPAQTGLGPGRQRGVTSNRSLFSTPAMSHGIPPGTSPDTFMSHGPHHAPALQSTTSGDTRSMSNTTQPSMSTGPQYSTNSSALYRDSANPLYPANPTTPYQLNTDNSTGDNSFGWPEHHNLLGSTPGHPPPETPQISVDPDPRQPARPSTHGRRRGIRKKKLTPEEKRQTRQKKIGNSICTTCKFKRTKCNLGEEGSLTRCLGCTSRDRRNWPCTRYHYLHQVEQGATQFNDQHCIYALLPAASVMASTIPDITARLAEYEEAGWTHIRLQRDGIQVQGECSFSVKALLSFFRHVGKARPLQVTFREFMDPLVVLDKDIMERLQACVTTKVDLQPITLFDDVDVGLPFRFQLYNDKHWESGWDVPNSVVIALFIALGRQLEFKALSELMSKIPSARASTSDLEYLGQRLHAMRLAFRKRSQEVTPSTTTVLLGELCKNLAMLHHLKQDDMAKKSKSAAVHCPSIPTLFPHGPTEQAIAEWLVSL